MESYRGYCDCCDTMVTEDEINEETGQHIGCERHGLVTGFVEPVVWLADHRAEINRLMRYVKILQERGFYNWRAYSEDTGGDG